MKTPHFITSFLKFKDVTYTHKENALISYVHLYLVLTTIEHLIFFRFCKGYRGSRPLFYPPSLAFILIKMFILLSNNILEWLFFHYGLHFGLSVCYCFAFHICNESLWMTKRWFYCPTSPLTLSLTLPSSWLDHLEHEGKLYF